MARTNRAAAAKPRATTPTVPSRDVENAATTTAWRPHRATAPVAYVIEAVQQRIRSGQLVPGQRLIEGDLCTELNVKRGPVREALRILAGDGILELVAQRGTRVRKLTVEDLTEMMPVMAGLVATTIRLAVIHLRKASVRGELEKHMVQMRYAAKNRDLGQFQLAGMHYMNTLQRAAGNRLLDYLSAKLHPDLLHHQIPVTMRIENWKSYLRHFDQVHSALLSGDASRAITLIYQHEDQLMDMLRSPERPVVWR